MANTLAPAAVAAPLSKADVQAALLSFLGLAAILARITPTTKDDAVVALLMGIVTSPDMFDQLWAVINTAQPATV